jgi:signal transduction histidine kinase
MSSLLNRELKFIHSSSKVFLLLVFLLCSLSTQAQNPAYRNYDVRNGLPSSEVYNILQDSKGFIWFATDNGVARFDGLKMKVINAKDGLPDPVVFGLYEDKRKRIWFRTFSGATAYYDKGMVTKYPFNKKLIELVGNRIVSMISYDDDEGIIIATAINGNISKIDTRGTGYVFEQYENSLFAYVQRDSTVLVGYNGTSTSLTRFIIDGKQFNIELSERTQHSAVVGSVRLNNNVYIFINRDVFSYDGGNLRKVFQSRSPIISLSVDRRNRIWIGYLNNGVECFGDEQFKNSFKFNFLENRSVTKVLHDSEGGFWISTLDRGVYYIPNPEIKHYDFEPDSKISGVTKFKKQIVVGDYKGKLSVLDPRNGSLLFTTSLNYPVVSIYADEGSDYLFVSTLTATLVLNQSFQIVSSYPIANSIKSFYRDNLGALWGVSQGGVFKFDTVGHLLNRKQQNLWGRHIHVNHQRALFAGRSGLSRTDSSFQNFTPIEQFSDEKITGIHDLTDEMVLITTSGSGFYVEKHGRFRKYDSLLFNNIFSVSVVRDSTVYLGTEKGLSEISIQSLANEKPIIISLSESSGLKSNKINFITNENNAVWVFTDFGYAIMPMNLVTTVNKNPEFYVEDTEVNGHQLPANAEQVLSYYDNNIKLSYGFISFNNRTIRVQHKVTRNQIFWEESEPGILSLYSLKPGEYEIQIRYTVDGLNWQNASFPNTFVIKPPWWESLYFQIGSGIFVAMVASIVFYWRLTVFKKTKRHEEIIQTKARVEKERIAQDLHDNIGSRLTTVSLSLLTLSKNSANVSQVKSVYEMVNATIDELRDSIWAIDKEEISLAEFADKVSTMLWRYRQVNEKPECIVEIPTGVETVQLKPLQAISCFRIIQEAINNCFKHSNCSAVNVNINVVASDLHLSITDNGDGFDSLENFAAHHFGIRNMEKRAGQVNGKLDIESHPEKGTKIKLRMPLDYAETTKDAQFS